MKLALAAAACLLVAADASAAFLNAQLCHITPAKQKLFFSNGVGNTPAQAYVSASTAQELLLQTPAGAALLEPSRVSNLYHENNGAAQDVAETLLQKARVETANPNIVWDNLVAVARGAVSAQPISLAQLFKALSDFDAERLKQKSLAQIDAEAAKDVQKVVEYLKSNPESRALVVGHSQGTLYANSLMDHSIRAQAAGIWPIAQGDIAKKIRIVNIGAAASYVAGQAAVDRPPQYVTSSNDKVILGLRGAAAAIGLADPMAANNTAAFVRTPPSASPPLGLDPDYALNHGFVSTYLYDTTSNYPAMRLLEYALLEQMVPLAAYQERVQVQVDVQSPVAQTNFADGTAPDQPPQYLSGPFRFGDPQILIEQLCRASPE
jgi:outer membrane protein OmpA-like peptidoglycan-associated protein